MATIKAPAPKAAQTEAPTAPDLSKFSLALTDKLSIVKDSEGKRDGALFDILVEGRAVREEFPDAEREQIKATVAQALADTYSLKLEHVTKAPDKTLRQQKPADFTARNNAYTLLSELVTMIWPKGEAEDKAVAKKLKDGETRISYIRKASKKKQTRPDADPDANKITAQNFLEKLDFFLATAATDLGETIEQVRDRALEGIETLKKAPKES